MEEKDLLQQLKSRFHTFSKGQKQIATYIMDNYDRAAFATASKMGRTVGVSESTVVRFAYTLGYDGYPALQHALQELIRNKLTSMQRMQMVSDIAQPDVLKSVLKADMQNIRATIEFVDERAFDNAVAAILAAERIYIIGMRSAYPIAQFLSYYLGFISTGVVAVNNALHDACEVIANIQPGDACIAISFPRYSARTAEAIRYARQRGANTIAMTDSHASPLAAHADHLLLARSDMASFADSLVAPLSLANAIIVAAGQSRREYLLEQFDRLEQMWDDQQVYVKSREQAL
ncbi:MurR/RpiR family transcriptional regulator [Christensenellaceae bacterium OttesenSCG-928-L17]|nr:MurR/RpiR family transcriptional regulator [Christensenellaceae bacterium OttesenSCG-928-L17]